MAKPGEIGKKKGGARKGCSRKGEHDVKREGNG